MNSDEPQAKSFCRLLPLPKLHGRYPSADEERLLIYMAQSGDDRAKKFLVSVNEPFIKSKVSEFIKEHRMFKTEDLIGEAVLWYVHAIEKFDLARDTRLTTYSAPWIYQGLNRLFMANRSIVFVPFYAQALDRIKDSKPEIHAAAEAALRAALEISRPNRDHHNRLGTEPVAKVESDIATPSLDEVLEIVDEFDNPQMQLTFYLRLEGKRYDEISEIVGLNMEQTRRLLDAAFVRIQESFIAPD
jgi:DNA-directed RNA polymerase specialized sigma24 family protein